MLDAPSFDFKWFCLGFLPCTACCAQYSLRTQILGTDWPQGYRCCNGYFACCGSRGGSCGESSCPEFCLCTEVFFCYSCALSTNRMLAMDKWNIHPDPSPELPMAPSSSRPTDAPDQPVDNKVRCAPPVSRLAPRPDRRARRRVLSAHGARCFKPD